MARDPLGLLLLPLPLLLHVCCCCCCCSPPCCCFKSPAAVRLIPMPGPVAAPPQAMPTAAASRLLPCRHAYCLPLGNVTTEHARHATAKLLQYDTVIDLDDTTAARHKLLSLGLGWQHTLSDMRARPSSGDPLTTMSLIKDDVLPQLAELNAVDVIVYGQAQLMARVDGIWLTEVEELVEHLVDQEQVQEMALEQGQQPGGKDDMLGSMMSTEDLAALLAARLQSPSKECGYFGSWLEHKAIS